VLVLVTVAAAAIAMLVLAKDNPVNMMITVALLEAWGLRVTQVVNGRAAVDAALQAHADGQPFDVVLMDLQMPVLDGLAATREIRAQGLPTPIVALTATVVERDWADARSAGLHAVLAKPVDSERLHAVLSQLAPAAGV
jgi:CheY-like chemotaxis protein